MSYRLIVPIVAVLTVGCNSPTPQETMIQNYLAKVHESPELVLVEARLEAPTLATDSFNIINEIFAPARDSALMHLRSALEHAQIAHQTSVESKATCQFPALLPTIEETIEQSAAQIEYATTQIAALEADCKGTEWEWQYNLVERYKAMGDAVLLQKYTCTFKMPGSDAIETKTVFLPWCHEPKSKSRSHALEKDLDYHKADRC